MSERQSGPRSGESIRALRWRIRIFTGVVVAGLLLTVGTGTIAGSGTHFRAATPVKYTAPYSGVEGAAISTLTDGCSAKLKFPIQPFFNLSTNRGTASVQVTVKSCGSANTSALAMVSAGFEGNPFSPSKSGVDHLKATANFDFKFSIVATPGGVGQFAEASYGVAVGFDYLLDVTNGTSYVDTFTSGVGGVISSGTSSSGFTNLHLTSYLNASLLKTHMYRIGVGFDIQVFAFVTPGSSSASALVNMGSAGEHSNLLDVIRSS